MLNTFIVQGKLNILEVKKYHNLKVAIKQFVLRISHFLNLITRNERDFSYGGFFFLYLKLFICFL